MAYTKTPVPAKKAPKGDFNEKFDTIGSGWNMKNGGPGMSIVINKDTTLPKDTRVVAFATKTKTKPGSPDYVICVPLDAE